MINSNDDFNDNQINDNDSSRNKEKYNDTDLLCCKSTNNNVTNDDRNDNTNKDNHDKYKENSELTIILEIMIIVIIMALILLTALNAAVISSKYRFLLPPQSTEKSVVKCGGNRLYHGCAS